MVYGKMITCDKKTIATDKKWQKLQQICLARCLK